MTSIEIGDFRVTHIRAGSYWWDGGAMFGVVPRTLWSNLQPPDELNRIEAGFNCFVVETGRRRVLIETGGGVRHDSRALERMRLAMPPHLPQYLADLGFEPDSFDLVVNTHLHWDHAGGNTVDESGKVLPALPNARYIVQRGELMHARERHPRDAISYRPPNYEPLVESGRMLLMDGDGAIAADLLPPGLEVRVTAGHNRDMTIVMLRSGDQTWCHLADLVQYASQLTPTWVSGFDLFPLEAIDNRTRILGQAAADGWWCSFGHDPSVAFAKIEVREGKWRVRESLI